MPSGLSERQVEDMIVMTNKLRCFGVHERGAGRSSEDRLYDKSVLELIIGTISWKGKPVAGLQDYEQLLLADRHSQLLYDCHMSGCFVHDGTRTSATILFVERASEEVVDERNLEIYSTYGHFSSVHTSQLNDCAKN